MAKAQKPQCGNCGSYKTMSVRTLTLIVGFVFGWFFLVAGIFFWPLWAGCLVALFLFVGGLFGKGKQYQCLSCQYKWTDDGGTPIATQAATTDE